MQSLNKIEFANNKKAIGGIMLELLEINGDIKTEDIIEVKNQIRPESLEGFDRLSLEEQGVMAYISKYGTGQLTVMIDIIYNNANGSPEHLAGVHKLKNVLHLWELYKKQQ